jgi:CheY-like chemotaxis protein
MPTKVLVFESDSAFAGELRNELGKLGCATTVVDDGNVGLQQAGADKPDLILLSIELPRMNGFSVCNKLKKDAGLKDVPLIIMSSESSDETFEQHKKLRTRAEDYVHKPIAFGELLQHIRGFVSIENAPVADADTIVIDDEIEVGSSDYLIEEDAIVHATEKPEKKVDADIDAFAESAFGRLTEVEASPPPPVEARSNRNGAAAEGRAASPRSVPPPPRHMSAFPRSLTPAAPPVDTAELTRLRDDLSRAKERLDGAEREMEEVRREADKLRLEAGEAERLVREVDELKTKLASSPKGGGVSSRDFLDLREALNKKDKEIVETQDKMLALERGKADLDDRMLVVERELSETKEKFESLTADKELAKRASDDFKARFEKARGEVEAKDKQLAELRAKHSTELGTLQTQLESERAEADQTIANERAEQARLIDLAEERRTADMEQAKRDTDAAVAEAGEKADGVKSEALSAQAAELRREHDAKVGVLTREHEAKIAGLAREHEQSLDRARAEAKDAAAAAERRRDEDLAAARKEAEEKLEAAAAEARRREEEALQALRHELTAKMLELENDRDAKIANLEAKGSRELGEANDKLAKVDVEFSVVSGELESLRENKRTGDLAFEAKVAKLEKSLADTESSRSALDKDLAEKIDRLVLETLRADKAHAKWESDKQSLERAKDALAVALAQIEEAESRS